MIDQMYSSINEKNILGAIKKYEKGKEIVPMAKRITKKGSYIDDEIKSKISPGPASMYIFKVDKANIQV